jgi:predicted dehydrogenase
MRLVILDPGHFHAALVQKRMYPDVDPTVHVYAPAGPDLDDYLSRIESFNTRTDNPTCWRIAKHVGPDFLERFVAERAGDVVVIAGNNRRKTEYLAASVAAGYHTLADKPMAIDGGGFERLRRAFDVARGNGVLLYDIMTERFEIATMLQKAFSRIEPVFGTLLDGTPDRPAVTKESVHHFAKLVAGAPVRRPGWFFDTDQLGDGIVDVTTHLVDLIQWECFPDRVLDWRSDVRVERARRWPTVITPEQFERVTGLPAFPDDLRKDVQADGNLHVYANGEFDYVLLGVHGKVSVRWDYEAPPGGGDTHFSIMRGSRASLVIRQGAAQRYVPVLYVEPAEGVDAVALGAALAEALPQVERAWPGVGASPSDAGWEIAIPAKYHVGHEAHFAQVTEQFLRYVAAGSMPDWEVPGMIAKYFTTTEALALAKA